MTAWSRTPPSTSGWYFYRCNEPQLGGNLCVCFIAPSGAVRNLGGTSYCSPDYIKRFEMEFWPIPIAEPVEAPGESEAGK